MYINLDSTKFVDDLINKAEQDVNLVLKSVMNVPADYLKSSFQMIRKLHGKETKVQAHIITQKFDGDVTPDEANKIGMTILEIIADGFQGVVFTSVVNGRVQNQIVINAVGLKNGLKYVSDKRKLYLVRRKSMELVESYK